MAKKPLQTLYESLRASNYDVPDNYGSFERTLTAPGTEGVRNRQTLYQSLRSSGYDVPDSYESFSRTLFAPVKPVAKPAASKTESRGLPLGFDAEVERRMRTRTPKQTHPLNKSRARQQLQAQQQAIENQQQRWQQESDRQKSYVEQRTSKVPGGMERFEERAKEQLATGEAAPVPMAPNDEVVRGDLVFDENGQMQQSYQVGSDMYSTRAGAEAELYRDAHPLEDELQQAYLERERLQEELGRAGNEAYNAYVGSGAGFMPLAAQGAAMHNSPEFSMLSTAYHQNEQRIKTLERERDADGFWRTLGKELFSLDTWDFGAQEFMDAGNLLRFGEGDNLTDEQQEARESMLLNTFRRQGAEQEYGENDTFMQSAATITAQAIPFVVQFLATGGMEGVTAAGSKLGSKMAAKLATGKVGEWILKNTGVLAGDVAAGFAMANTVGALSTGADIMGRHQGQVVQGPDGTFHFEGGKSWGRSIYEGEVANTLEYYTEMLGAHLDGVGGAIGAWISKSKAGQKIGIEELSRLFSRVKGSEIYNATNHMLRKGGFHEYPSEVIEEEANIFLNALLVGDNKFSDLIDKKTQLDIWGGMILSVGFMQSPGVVGGTMQAAQYYRYKQNTNLASIHAGALLGAEKWAALKDGLDNATNTDAIDILHTVMADESITDQQRGAVVDYVANMLKMRGYNLRTMADAKDKADEEPGATIDLSNEYQEGYETVTPEERRAAKDRLDVARARLEQKGYSEQWMQWVDSTPIDDVMSDLTERGLAGDTEAVREYLNAKAAYDGMLQRVNDDIDNDVAVAGEAIEQRVAPEPQGGDGMIHPAVLKDGRDVFIVSGNVATLADNSIDVENSDDMIIVRNEVGDIYNITPNDIESLGEVVDPAQQRQQVEQEITETQSQAAAAQIEGALPFNVGDQYTISYQGEPHTYEVVQVDENNVEVLVDGGQEPVVLTKQQLQQMADDDRGQQIQAQAAAADAVEEEPAAEEGAAQNAAIPEQPTAPVAEETPAAPEDNPTAAMPMDDQGEPAWDQVEPERGHQFLYQESGWPQAMADNFVQKRIDEAEKALKKAQEAGQKLIDNPKPTFAENNAAVAENNAAQQAAQAALGYWNEVKAIQAAATAPVVEETAPVVETPAEQEPTEQAPVDEAEAPAAPVEETPVAEEEQPVEESPAPVAENEMQPVEEEQPAEAAPAVPDTETAQSAATEDQAGGDNAPQSEATPGQEAGNSEPTREELIEQIKEEFADVLEDGDVEIVPESVHEQGAEVVANITIDGEPTNIWLAVGEGAQVNEHWRSIYVPLENMDWQEISDLADEYNALDGKVCEADSEVKRINFKDVWEAAQFESVLANREEEKQEADVVYYTPADDIRYSIESQGEVPQGEKPKAFNMGEATGNDGNQKGFTLGVYHDPSGTAVATDSYIMIVDSREYDEQHKGKVIAQNNVKKGSEVKVPVKKGEEIPVERYPKWKSVWPKKKETESVKVDFNKLCGWLAGVEKRMKEQWQQWKKEHPGEKMSFDNWRSRSAVQILMPDGKVQRFKFDNLYTFARAAASQGAKSLRYYPNQDNRAFSFDSKFGGGLVMPYNLEAFSYVNNPYRVENGLSVNLDSSLFTYDMSNGATMPGKTAGNRVELNVESGKDAESRAYIEEVMEREGWDEDAKSEFRKMLDDAADLVTRIAKGYTRLREWNKKKLTDENGNYNPLWRVFDKKDGWIPNRSSFKKNGEYPYNIDLGALCTKREAFDAVVRYIKEQGWGQNLGPTQIEALKSLLRKHGFLTACDICFNETKRARGLDYGNAVAYYWNTVRAAVGIDDDLPIGTPRELTEEQVKMLTELSKPKSHKAFRKYIPQAVHRTYEFYINSKGERKRREADKGLTPTMASKIAKLFLQDPSLMGKFEGTLLLSTDGVDALVRQYPHTTLAEFIAGAWGSATPKPNEGFNVYDPLSWKQTYDKKRQRPAMDWFFNLGGFRAQSFSDYHPIFFYDYVQMFTDLAIRRLPIHIYTKVPALIKLFGGTGAKFNMSLVPEVVQGVDPEHLGLKPDGNGGWELAWHDDSFPVDEAFALRQDPRFKGNVGTIAVGISDAHIRMLLDDPRIDMVIPYHKSGMPTSVQVKTGLNNATDYTDDQKTKGMKKGLKDFSFNEALRRLGDPRKAADEYLAWCKQNKCTPKFPQFADHPNYYKVLEDFRCIDNEGNYSAQQPVQMNLFDDVEQRLAESLEDRTMQEGLDNAIRGNDEITEGIKKIMSKPRLDGKIRDMMLARLKQVLGKDNVASLKQEDFFEELQKVYTDQMGAERAQQQVEVLRTSGGIVYGFAVGDRIVLNENYFNAETPMHEFTHVWVKVARLANPQMWAEGKELLKQTKEWQDVMNDEFYRDIHGDEDAVASEVLARIVGQDAARQINEMFAPEDKPQERPGIYNKIKQWVNKFLDGVRSLFDSKAKGLTYDELVRMPMKALFDDAEAARFMEALQQVNEEDATPEYQAKSLGAPYQGSKGQIATRIVDALPSGKRFVDLFSGGGAVTHAAMLSGKYEGYRMNDINPAGQELFMAGMRGDYRDYQPRELTAEEFKAIKGTPEGLLLSYSGLGRNVDSDKESVARRLRRVQRLEELKPYADQVEPSNTDYREVQLQPGDVVYADIPYEGTNKTGYREGAKFDKQAFSDWALGQDVPIYVSEQSMPEGWVEVQSWNMKAMRGKTRGEKLFVQAKFAGDQGRGTTATQGTERATGSQYSDNAQGDQTRSANFKNWFGDWENDPENASKVVDEEGRPLVMTHNTDQQFTIFDRGRIGTGQGQAYIGLGFNFSRGRNSTYGGNAMEVYLNARNPLQSDGHKLTASMVEQALRKIDEGQEDTTVAEFAGAFVPYGTPEYDRAVRKVARDFVRDYDDLSIYSSISVISSAKADDVIEAFKELGFDSTIERDSEGRIMNAVVFDPNQVKSAEAVTRDDNGNVIPLSQRFDLGVDDIRFRQILEDGGTLRVYQREGMGWQNVDEVNLREDNGEWTFNRTIPGRFESRDAALDALLDYSRQEGLQAHADPGSNTYTLRRRLPKGQKWRVEGVPGEFDTQFSAVDNARNFLQGHVFEVAEDGTSIEVLGAGSNLDAITGRGEAATQETATETAPQTAKERRAEERARKWRERTVANGRRRVEELGQRLGVKVTIVDDMSEQERDGMSKKKRRAKGWYDVRTGEVFINLGNHRTVSDIEATFLHEVVAHKGLRRLFGDEFDKFLHNVYYNVDASIREEINRLMAKNNWDYREATEEYLAKLAQQMNFERPEKYLKAWETVARLFRQLLQKMGLGNGMNLKDSDLQGILFESYHNMEKEGVAGLAESVEFRDAMEREANRGNATAYETAQPAVDAVASEPNGDQTRSANFKNWFGDWENDPENASKVVDENGEPKVVLHGTPNGDFYVFDPEKAGSNTDAGWLGTGFYFYGNAPEYASQYAGKNGRVLRVYLDIKNPYIASVEESNRLAEANDPEMSRRFREQLEAEGYDGVYYNGDLNEEWVAFYPEQIKSATENNGDFDPNNPDIRFRDDDDTIDDYNHEVNTLGRVINVAGRDVKPRVTRFNFQEAFQDAILSVKKLQQVVCKKYGLKSLPSKEDAWTYENRLQSINMRERKHFINEIYEKMMKVHDKLLKNGATVDEINEYVICKHGLERNQVFAQRDANAEANEIARNGGVPDMQQLLDKYRQRDYSGLTAITGLDDIADIEAEAQRRVDAFEQKHGALCNELWNRINDATKWTLRRSYECGMMSAQTYIKVRDMFQWYVPLRGFNETTAEDVYDYMMGDRGAFNGTLKTAEGRTSLADDPFATIGNMGESAIVQGNRNKLKQRLWNMATQHPTDVCQVRDMWVVQDAQGNWIADFPDIPEDADADTIAQILEDHETAMTDLENRGLAKRVRNDLDIGYRIDQRNVPEHAVVVMMNGDRHVVYINGNPRAAQAINGNLSSDKGSKSAVRKLFDFFTKDIRRYYSSVITSYNINFSGANFVRDLPHAYAMTFTKYGFARATRYIAKSFQVIPWIIKNQLGVSGNSRMDQLFHEFVNYGGVTGYAHINDVDAWKADNRRRLARLNALGRATVGTAKAIKAVIEVIGWFSETLELIPRFTTYCASRDAGMDIQQSIKEAKDITTNFNKKGTEMTPGVWGAVANTLRYTKMFFNPIVQGMYQWFDVAKDSKAAKARLAGVMLWMPAMGAMIPYLNQFLLAALGGDDDDDYFLQNEFTRRQNMLIFTGKGYVKIPIAPVFRELYGMGETVATRACGRIDDRKMAADFVDQLRTIFSLEGQSNYREWSFARAVAPDQYAPIVDIMNNENFTGKQLWYESDWTKSKPEYTKAKESTWSPLVNISRTINEWLGGDEDIKADQSGKWLNPVVWQHLITNYGGGFAQVLGDVTSSVNNMLEGESTDVSQWPIAKRFYTEPTAERANWARYALFKQYETEYNKAKDKYAALKKRGVSAMEMAQEIDNFAQRHPRAASIYAAWNGGIKGADYVQRMKKLREEGNDADYWALVKEAVGKADNAMRKGYAKAWEEERVGRPESMSDDELYKRFDNAKTDSLRAIYSREIATRNGIRDALGKAPSSNWKEETKAYWETYKELRNSSDILEDAKAAKILDDDEKKYLKEIRQGLGQGDDDAEIMEEHRRERQRMLKEHGE